MSHHCDTQHTPEQVQHRSSSFPTTTIAPKNILFSWLVLTVSHIYQMQKHGTLHILILFAKDIWVKYPHCSKPREKGLQGSHKQSGKVMSITSLQISWGDKSWKNIGIVASQNQTLQFKVQGGPWMFIHTIALIQKCEDCTRLTANRHGMHWNCQSL